jgi:hypothetical protein
MTAIVKSKNFEDLSAEEQTFYENEKVTNQQLAEQKATEEQANKDLKASARAKLMSGEALTEDEAKTVVI